MSVTLVSVASGSSTSVHWLLEAAASVYWLVTDDVYRELCLLSQEWVLTDAIPQRKPCQCCCVWEYFQSKRKKQRLLLSGKISCWNVLKKWLLTVQSDCFSKKKLRFFLKGLENKSDCQHVCWWYKASGVISSVFSEGLNEGQKYTSVSAWRWQHKELHPIEKDMGLGIKTDDLKNC